jgi:hypothetical protein
MDHILLFGNAGLSLIILPMLWIKLLDDLIQKADVGQDLIAVVFFLE